MQIWNRRPTIRARYKLWWSMLWIRRGEFHPSLDLDPDILASMCPCEMRRYQEALARRRQIAHDHDEQEVER